MLSAYDEAHVAEILAGEGSWFTARLLRALDELLAHADECAAIIRHYQGGPS
jgi:hypothetical protein